jgi:hypothetical protein
MGACGIDVPGLSHRFRSFDFDRFQNAVGIDTEAGLTAMGFDHQFERLTKVSTTFVKAAAMGDGAGDFLDPPHKPPVGFGFDDGVETLPHIGIKTPKWATVKKNFSQFNAGRYSAKKRNESISTMGI